MTEASCVHAGMSMFDNFLLLSKGEADDLLEGEELDLDDDCFQQQLSDLS